MELACRPAVVLSYGIAAVAALLSGLAYAELIVDMPLAGGAFSCILAVFSEPFAWYAHPVPQHDLHCMYFWQRLSRRVSL